MNQKKLLSRKQKALRRTALALALLLIVNFGYRGFYFLPVQALRDSYETYGILEPEVVCRKLTPELEYAEMAYLTQGRGSLHFTLLSHIWVLGWNDHQTVVLDCRGDKKVHAEWTSTVKEGGTECLILLGKVSKNVCRIDFSFEEGPSFLAKNQPQFQETVPVEEWIETENGRYFLTFFDWIDRPWLTTCQITMTAYDESGGIIEQQDLSRIP